MNVEIGAAAAVLIVATAISGSARRAVQGDRGELEAIEHQWLASVNAQGNAVPATPER